MGAAFVSAAKGSAPMDPEILPPGAVLELSRAVHPVWRLGPATLHRLDARLPGLDSWVARHSEGCWLYRLHSRFAARATDVWQVHVGDALSALCGPRLLGHVPPGRERRLRWQALGLLGARGVAVPPRLHWTLLLDFGRSPEATAGVARGAFVALAQGVVGGRTISVVTGDGPQALEERPLPPSWILLQQLGRWWLGSADAAA